MGGEGLIIKDRPQGLRKGELHLSSLWGQSEKKVTMHIGFLHIDLEQAKPQGSTPAIFFGLGPG